jgi:hypothetical protein
MVRIGAAAFDGVDRHGRINPDGSEMPGDSVEEQTGLEARAKAEAAESVVTTDYYTQLPQIRLGDFTGRSVQPETTAEVMLDGDCKHRSKNPSLKRPVSPVALE